MTEGKKETQGAMSKPLLYLWLVGVAIVAHSFLWHGCLHFTCASGTNGEVTYRSRRSSGSITFLGMHDSVADCELACWDAQNKKGCHSFTYFESGDLAQQCFASMDQAWSVQGDASAVSGRPFFLTKASITAASHPFAVTVKDKFAELLVAIEAWPIVAKVKEAAAQMPPRPVLSEKAWLLASAVLFFWPALLSLIIGASPSVEEREAAEQKLAKAKVTKAASAAPPPAEEPKDDKADEKIPIISDVVDLGTNVGKELEQGLKNFAENIQSLMKPEDQQPAEDASAATAQPAAN